MPGRVIAIGDIHGCSSALERLLGALDLGADDQLITLGDVIDRGPNSRRVVDLLLDISRACRYQPVLGNHEEMMLAALRGSELPEFWLANGGAQTLESYGFTGDLNAIPPTHIWFLASGLDYVETESHFFIHANYLSDVPLPEQPPESLRWTTLDQHLPARHASGKVAVVGHTAERSGEILALPHLKCIDTFCYGGGWLTALDISSGRIWQTNNAGELRVR